MKKLIIGSLALFASGAVMADGSPWIGTPGSTSVNISNVLQSADELYVGSEDGDLPDDLKLRTQWLSIGHVVSDDLVVDIKLGYAESEFLDSNADSGSTDSSVGLTWRLRDEFLADSWLPSVAVRGAVNIAGAYSEGELPSIGDGASGAEASIIVGKVFNNVFAASSEVGYRYRDSGVDDDIFVNINAYAQVNDQFSASLGYHQISASGDLDIGGQGFTGDFTEVAEDVRVVDFGLTYEFQSRINVTASYGEVIGGRNTAKSEISAISVGYTF